MQSVSLFYNVRRKHCRKVFYNFVVKDLCNNWSHCGGSAGHQSIPLPTKPGGPFCLMAKTNEIK